MAVSWLASIAPDRSSFDEVFSLRGDLHDSYQAFYSLFWEQQLVDPVLLEVVRLRIARLNGCASEMGARYRPALDAGFGEEQAIEALGGVADPGNAKLGELERACLVLAEKFVLDVQSIEDEDVVAVRDVIGEAALVALTEAMALFDGFTRFRAILGAGAFDGSVTVVDAPMRRGARG